ncbi:quinoprotein dehydrogenase-associated putative ABC transporter substrate-binding protein [Sphingomonas quercus]|uniref:Quinoprotein dehydrogenase-associated putative ABC transporter substrate-binding protein n=1 Tax=Sphingomonas quercus TaxID=2842451 RepID=A0ABS6BG86_9SPHN|nr:quinoprotein dehydrogenase-associated putative ABC transporter substrate-binding protein [Sphingomonas quercus]MBU3077313.1 quinoprotein dehydrogenase-associated putative ABC transporter substrate-binding protein [Sphingomonas quercus]
MPAAAAPARAVLRVCADPNNMPFSNRAEQGFENALVRLIARDMNAELRYVWWAQRRGNLRETLRAGQCDLVPGVGSTLEAVATSTPYYRSSYVVVARRHGSSPVPRSFDDPRLRHLRIGVQLIGDDGINTPPAHALTRRGIVRNVRGFMVQGDYRRAYPQDAILDALTSGKLDIAYVWGPVAGYYRLRHPERVAISPVSPLFDGPQLPMVFDISVAARRDDTVLLRRVDAILERRRAEIERLLRRYGVPLVAR